MKNKMFFIVLIMFSLILLTGCGKKTEDDDIEVVKRENLSDGGEEAGTKELTCKTDMTQNMQGKATALFSIHFIQDLSTFELSSGEAEIVIDYSENETLTEKELNDSLPGMKTSFCSRDYFGPQTTKGCELKVEGKTINITIEIDTDAFLKAAGVEESDLNAQTLQNLREGLEQDEKQMYKCSIK